MAKEDKAPVDRNDPLLRELEEEIRRERYAKLWEQYGVYAVAAAVAVVLAVGGYQIWDWRRQASAEAAGTAYEAAQRAIQGGKTDEALKSLEALAQEGPGGYAALSRLQIAGAHAKAGRTAEAVTAYEALASDGGADPLLRDFARLQAAYVRAADADWGEMQTRLNELLTEGNPWYSAARELWGVAALKAGRRDEARDAFAQLLADKRTPAQMRERVSLLLSTLVATDGAKPADGASKPLTEAPSSAAAAASPPAESGKQ